MATFKNQLWAWVFICTFIATRSDLSSEKPISKFIAIWEVHCNLGDTKLPTLYLVYAWIRALCRPKMLGKFWSGFNNKFYSAHDKNNTLDVRDDVEAVHCHLNFQENFLLLASIIDSLRP